MFFVQFLCRVLLLGPRVFAQFFESSHPQYTNSYMCSWAYNNTHASLIPASAISSQREAIHHVRDRMEGNFYVAGLFFRKLMLWLNQSGATLYPPTAASDDMEK